jgi:hypothetical protein
MTTDEWMILTVAVVEFVNICLLLGLISVYWRNYRKVKNEFSIGLLFFSSTFLLKSILFLVLLGVFLIGGFGEALHITEGEGGRGPFALFLLDALECVALAFLFKITWE